MWRRFARLVILGAFLAVSALCSAQQDQTSSRKVLTRVEPEYPRLARSMHLGGTVKVEALVAPNGTVRTVSIRGGPPVLTTAAADAVRRWKWAPAAHESYEPVELKFKPPSE